MKYLLSYLFMLAAVVASSAVPEFVGVFATSEERMFALTGADSGDSKWLKLGQQMDGYRLESYVAESQLLRLIKDGETWEVRLRHAKIAEGYSVVSGRVILGGGKVLNVSDAILVPGVESAFPVSDGVVLKLRMSRRPDGNLRYESKFEVRGASGQVDVLGGPAMIAKPGQEFSMKSGDYEYAFTPKKA